MSVLRSPGKEHLHNVKWLPATLAGVKVFASAGTRVKAIAGMGEVSDRQATSSQTPTHQEQATLQPRAL